MDVKWQYETKPKTGEFGVSKQCVLLTNFSAYNIGYWDINYNEWIVEGLMMFNEVVVAWLEGLE